MRRVAVGLVLGALAGCVDASYRCDDDSQCSLTSDGRCEAVGFCSYPDDACESGRRAWSARRTAATPGSSATVWSWGPWATA